MLLFRPRVALKLCECCGLQIGPGAGITLLPLWVRSLLPLTCHVTTEDTYCGVLI